MTRITPFFTDSPKDQVFFEFCLANLDTANRSLCERIEELEGPVLATNTGTGRFCGRPPGV